MSTNPKNEELSVSIRAARAYCGECGIAHILDIAASITSEDVKQARWWDGWAELTHGGWVCGACLLGHTNRDLFEAAEVVRGSHQAIRIDPRPMQKSWSAR